MSVKIATPVSHLFEHDELARALTERSDVLELRDHTPPPTDVPLIHHCDLNLLSVWEESERDHLRALHERFALPLLSFHMSSRYKDNEVVDGRFVGVGDPYERDELVENAERNVCFVRELFGDVDVLVENNNHLSTDAYDVVTEPRFVSRVVDANDLGLLLDVGHAKITCANTRMSIEEYLSGLPLDSCRQVHLSRPRLDDGRAMDVHDFLTEDDWAFFNSIRDDLHRLEYATVEYYKSAPVLLDQLQLLRVGTSDIIVTDEPWDSDFFGRAIGSLAVRRLDDEVVEYALKRCEERGIECLYYTCDRSDKNSQRLATEHGFSKVDSRLIFRHDLGDIHGVSTEGVEVSEAVSSDVEELKRIARSVYSRTRFYRDDHFPDEACDELYATWIENAYEGFADVVTVARSNDGRPLGFVTCDLDDGTGEIGLVGVDAGVQGSGIGTTLVSDALRWFVERGADCATVATQAKNEAAVGLYERCGFERSRSEAIFHRWFNSA